MLGSLGAVVESAPRAGVFVPIRLGAEVVGGVALLRSSVSFGADALLLAERLSDVTTSTLEAYRTEQILFELFAQALPAGRRRWRPASSAASCADARSSPSPATSCR